MTSDPIVKRLRWVMIGAMLFSMFNTLVCQPASFWLKPETAIRGDGLRLHDHVNHTFEFFLGYGWQPYVVACLIYFVFAFLIVSLLPRTLGLVAVLSFIFGHYYGGCNWLAVRWHLGFTGVTSYSLGLSAAVAFSFFPALADSDRQFIRRLRWVIVAVFFVDFTLTLFGQPSAYWRHPEMVHEGNAMIRWFMLRGWVAFALMDVVYCAGLFWLASFLPRFSALMVIFGYAFGYFDGGSNWLYYEWRLGMAAPVLYGMLLSAVVAFGLLRHGKKPIQTADDALQPTASASSFCG